MTCSRFPLCAALAVLATYSCLTHNARAQATRTWISGVGDDANPCSRTAPCKTFAGAISKTVAHGEINVMDPGGFGGVTITKSITFDGQGTMASILVTGSPCITINAGDTDVVTLRNLSINGLQDHTTPATYGIRILRAGVVRIENCVIFGGTTNGINFQSTSPNAALYVQKCHIYGFDGAGIFIHSLADAKVVVTDSEIEQCAIGIQAHAGSNTMIRTSLITQNNGAGVDVGAGASVTLEGAQVSQNGTGIASAGDVTLSDSTVTGQTGAGLSTSAGGSILTYHNNKIFGNHPDGNPTGSMPLR